MDPFPLAALDCVLVNQVLTDSERGRTRKDEVGRVLLVHATGCNQRNLGKWRFEDPDVIGPTDLRAGKYLDKVGPGFPCRHDFAGRQGSGQDHNVTFQGEFNYLEVEAGTGQESGAGSGAAAGGRVRSWRKVLAVNAKTDRLRS